MTIQELEAERHFAVVVNDLSGRLANRTAELMQLATEVARLRKENDDLKKANDKKEKK